jgi:iron complex outermembrane recepter protein
VVAAPAGAQQPATLPTIPLEDPPSAEAEAAQAAEVFEPMVVTATKRDVALRELAGSVGASRGADLEALGAAGLEDHLKLVPGVSLNKEMADRADPSIRGIATETRFQSGQRATGFYLDEIPLSDPFIPVSQPDLHPFDLERIEVLKGPQGTLFGSMALAGAIHYIARKPVPGEFATRLQGSFASVAEGQSRRPHGAAMLNVPVGDDAALRGVFVTRDEPAFVDDTRTGSQDIGGRRQRQGRALGSWQVGDALTLSATWLEQRSRHDDSPFGDQRQRPQHGNTLGPSPTASGFDVGNLVAAYDFGWARLLSSTSRLSKEAGLRLEVSRLLGTGPSGEPVYTTVDAEAEGYAQELRLASPANDGGWEWLVGAWWQRYDLAFDQYVLNPGEGPEPPPDRSGDATQPAVGHYRSSGHETAVFADASFSILEPWTVSVGGRLYRVELESQNLNAGLLTLASTGRPEDTIEGLLTEQGFNPRLSTTFRIDRNVLSYLLVARGFRFGGVQIVPVAVGSDPPPTTYESDTLWSYEAGVRTDWLSGALRVDGTVFHGRWKDLQVTQLDSTGLTTYVANIGAARTLGLELALTVRPFSGATWTTSGALIEARTAERFAANGREVPSGTDLPGTPKLQLSTLVTYEFAGAALAPAVSLLHAHVGRSPSDLFGTEELGGYDTFDLRGRLALPALPMRPELALGVTNLTDVRGIAGAFATPTSAARDFYFINPRTLSLTTTLSF